MTYPRGTLIRNTTATPVTHWITGLCFVLLLLSGLSMFHPMLFFLSGLFGGGQWTRAIHPWIGIVLLVSYAGLIVQFLARQHVEPGRSGVDARDPPGIGE